MDTQAVLTLATSVARQAGAVLKDHFSKPIKQMTKATHIDIVTEADKAAEVVIVSALTQAYPDHHIVGEEGGGQGAPANTAEYFWYVDPLDGTTNFANKIPHFSVSIALANRNNEPLVGVIYHPIMDELFRAEKGQGAFLNGVRLHVSSAQTLEQSVLASGFPYYKHDRPDENNAREWSAFVARTRGERRFGSAALDFAYVAAGRFDGFWEKSLNLWDAMAGVALVLEAGGRVSNYQGDPSSARYREGYYVASNGYIHAAMLEVLQSVAQPHLP